ncbi:hypothetical protein ACSSVW_000697 [Pseudoalteromonas sp. MBR-15]|jgi:hypothetical protein
MLWSWQKAAKIKKPVVKPLFIPQLATLAGMGRQFFKEYFSKWILSII